MVRSLLSPNVDTVEVRKWPAILMAPGSSLGGARPKTNILEQGGTPGLLRGLLPVSLIDQLDDLILILQSKIYAQSQKRTGLLPGYAHSQA